MKFQKPTFLKNLTPKMLIIWAVSFVGAVVIIFGSIVTTLALVPKRYGIELKYDDISIIEYMNESQTKQLFAKEDEKHAQPMKEIIGRLEKGRKSNQLMNLFRGKPKQYLADSNNVSGIDFNINFTSNYAKNGLMIYFSRPQYHISAGVGTYDVLAGRGETGNNDIHAIYIPLDKTSNRVQEQTWFLVTTNMATATSVYIPIPNKLTFMANYSHLWEYINGQIILL